MNIVLLIFVFFLMNGNPVIGTQQLPEGTVCTDDLAAAVIENAIQKLPEGVSIQENDWLWDCKDITSPGPAKPAGDPT